jgi:hypothetical protein
MKHTMSLIVGLTAALAGGLATSPLGGPGAPEAHAASTPPRPSVAAFDHPTQNPYYPLVAGTVSRYRGTSDGERFEETVVVTHRHRTVEGVRTTVVRDVLRRLDGTVAERTHDWYAPDQHGNVWYFGEATATYDASGALESREGSWLAGEHGAEAGLIMPAHPRVSDAYRQEFRAGHAEDQAWIVQRGLTVRLPYGTVGHVIRSFEWTRLEPGVLSAKFYGRGLGIVRERDLAGGDEAFTLVSVSHR